MIACRTRAASVFVWSLHVATWSMSGNSSLKILVRISPHRTHQWTAAPSQPGTLHRTEFPHARQAPNLWKAVQSLCKRFLLVESDARRRVPRRGRAGRRALCAEMRISEAQRSKGNILIRDRAALDLRLLAGGDDRRASFPAAVCLSRGGRLFLLVRFSIE